LPLFQVARDMLLRCRRHPHTSPLVALVGTAGRFDSSLSRPIVAESEPAAQAC
jgi:hypothetical protein